MTSTDAELIETPAAGGYRIEPTESTISFATRHIFGLAPVHGTFALRDGHLDVRIDEVRVVDATLRLRGSAEVDRHAWGVTAMKGMTGRLLRFTLDLVATQLGA